MSRELLDYVTLKTAPSASGWARAECPFCTAEHGHDKKLSFTVNVESGVYRCFRCGARGKHDGFIGKEEHIERTLLLPDDEGADAPCPFYRTQDIATNPIASQYFLKRNVSLDIARQIGVKVALRGNEHWLTFPVRTVTGKRIMGWVSRNIETKEFVNSKGFKSATALYNWDIAIPKAAQHRILFVAEGIFDALSLWPLGVAFLGKPHRNQVELLVALAQQHRLRVVIALDGDAIRDAHALQLKLKLKGVPSVIAKFSPNEDPNSCSNLQEVVKDAVRRLR